MWMCNASHIHRTENTIKLENWTNYQKEIWIKLQKMFFTVSILFLFVSFATVVVAGDFCWIQDFNRRAEADLQGFRASLSARFKIGAVQMSMPSSLISRHPLMLTWSSVLGKCQGNLQIMYSGNIKQERVREKGKTSKTIHLKIVYREHTTKRVRTTQVKISFSSPLSSQYI